MLRGPAGVRGAPRSSRDVLRAAAVVALGASLAGACASEKDTGAGTVQMVPAPQETFSDPLHRGVDGTDRRAEQVAREHPGRGLPGQMGRAVSGVVRSGLLPWTTWRCRRWSCPRSAGWG